MHLENVGNDIVDLSDPILERHHHWERFIARVCSTGEREALSRARDPKRFLWSLFAAKEAAFKLVVKRVGPVPFSHRAFIVDDDLRAVGYLGLRYSLEVQVGTGWVHALVSTGAPAAFLVRRGARARSSEAARKLLTELAAPVLNCDQASLSVARAHAPEYWDALGPPRLLLSGQVVGLDVSLSHDGPFVAAALITQRAAG